MINPVTRKKCKKCRIMKCFESGMRRDWIMTDVEREEKRKKIQENRRRKLTDHQFQDGGGGGTDDDSNPDSHSGDLHNSGGLLNSSFGEGSLGKMPIRRRRRRRQNSMPENKQAGAGAAGKHAPQQRGFASMSGEDLAGVESQHNGNFRNHLASLRPYDLINNNEHSHNSKFQLPPRFNSYLEPAGLPDCSMSR